jgi:hypothetical protein
MVSIKLSNNQAAKSIIPYKLDGMISLFITSLIALQTNDPN